MRMLALEQEILKLQRIRELLGLYRTLLGNVQAELSANTKEHQTLETNHPGLLKDFVGEISAFCTNKIEELGNGPRPQRIPIQPIMPETLEKEPPPKEKTQVPQNNSDEPTDPLKFLLKYRHLEGKKVSFDTKNGEVTGTVKGMVTPHLRIETDTGHVASVRPTDIRIM